MNIDLRKSLLVLASIIVVGLTTGCDDSAKLPQLTDIGPETIVYTQTTSEFEVAMGLKSIYVLSGKMKGLSEGQLIELDGYKGVFSIGQFLTKFPQCKTNKSIAAAIKQQVWFKAHKSSLYDPNLVL